MKNQATIYDIAERVNVTPMTVSRALNNKGYVSEQTRQKIFEVAEELNYRPNLAAKSLKTAKTNQVLVAVIQDESFNYSFLKPVSEELERGNYSLILRYSQGKDSENVNIVDSMNNNYADALILMTRSLSPKLIETIKKSSKPCVAVTFFQPKGNTEGINYVSIDTKKGVALCAKHLAANGYKRIGYIGTTTDAEEGAERYQGYLDAMNSLGESINQDNVFLGNYGEEFGYQCGLIIASYPKEKRPDAICASSDLYVLGMYRAFEENDISVPEDIAIIGMDNIREDMIARPRISSVDIKAAEVGEEAVRRILAQLDDEKKKEKPYKHFEPEIIIRDSCH